MNTQKVNKCGSKRGCNVDLDICPSDGNVELVYSGMHGTENDTEAVLCVIELSLDKKEIKMAA